MKCITVLGAGKSAKKLIDYLLEKAKLENWLVQVIDKDELLAQKRINDHPNGRALSIDIMNATEREQVLISSDMMISLLPPALHIIIAKDCLKYEKHLVTASYISPEIKAMDAEVKSKNLVFMNEIGADPGIDHMSAVEILQKLKKQNAEIHSFKTYCGGLVAPASDNNPWHYKISWNPWNIVRAGSDGAMFKKDNAIMKCQYDEVFENYEKVNVLHLQNLAAYPNRNSLQYEDLYQLENVSTIIRATFRYENFIRAWYFLVQLGLTKADLKLNAEHLTYTQFCQEATKNITGNNIGEKLQNLKADEESIALIEYLNLERADILQEKEIFPATFLQKIIEEKWKLQIDDRDMLVFHHDIVYSLGGERFQFISSLIVEGENNEDTAMALCVGLPAAIFSYHFLKGNIKAKAGVQIPIDENVYPLILKELQTFGIRFEEKIIALNP